jgi:putative phosphoribosyl transferase
MIFKNRQDAGKQLIKPLAKYQGQKDTIVIGLPRGGVVLAYEVAKGLDLPLDVTCPRKIGAPGNPEFAIGAITETGEGIFNDSVIARLQVPESYLEATIAKERAEAQKRLDRFRGGMPPRDFADKTLIIVDDGLATGSTMKAAIKSMQAAGAKKIVVAIPVSPVETLEEIKQMVDETICLNTPWFFQAVGQFYVSFDQTTDEEVINLMQKVKQG